MVTPTLLSRGPQLDDGSAPRQELPSVTPLPTHHTASERDECAKTLDSTTSPMSGVPRRLIAGPSVYRKALKRISMSRPAALRSRQLGPRCCGGFVCSLRQLRRSRGLSFAEIMEGLTRRISLVAVGCSLVDTEVCYERFGAREDLALQK